jgi:multidrug efflux pump
LIADGPGAESRQAIGVVIVFGVTFSTLLTLFVIPAFYALFARNSKSPQYVNRMIEKLKKQPAAAPADPAHQP